MLRFRSLGSGSSGNATVVEATAGVSTTRLLVDCGFSLRALDGRLARAGLDARQIDAIFITHEHSDHLGCVRALALRERIPVWMSHGTWLASGAADFDGLLRVAAHGTPVDLGALRLHPFTVPHDARDPLQLHCTDGATRLGIVTDLGHASAEVAAQLAGCHALLLECNHDLDLLAASSYPPFLKRRVGGPHGHLANADAATLARTLQHHGLGPVVAAHLSARNNRPDLVRASLAAALNRSQAEIPVADPVLGSPWVQA